MVASSASRYVSRAGNKLEGALTHFGVVVEGRWVLDAGSSTGGFSQCLLQNGASHVTAIDVGTNQLHEHIRNDPRVAVRERTDIRHVSRHELDPRIDLVSVDLSFISLVPLIPHLVELAGKSGELIVLVKPQFEATKAEADKGAGVIVDPAIHARVLRGVMSALDESQAGIMGVMQSVLPGTSGNLEYFVYAKRGACTVHPTEFSSLVAQVCREVH